MISVNFLIIFLKKAQILSEYTMGFYFLIFSCFTKTDICVILFLRVKRNL